MTLWSSTILKDSSCPRRGHRLRQGLRGRQWEGYRVGSFVHDALFRAATGQPRPCNFADLTPLNLVEADRLLRNASEMGLPGCYPEGARFEESFLFQITGDQGEVEQVPDMPAWAIRGEEWDPTRAGDKTLYRLQPDVWYIDPEDPGVVCIDDYKTALGMTNDSAVGRNAQVVTYAAALCILTGCPVGRFTLWNLRWRQGQQVERSAEEWIEGAKRIWAACYTVDQRDEDLDLDYRPSSSRCSTCPFFAYDDPKAGCWGASTDGDDWAPDGLSAEELYQAAKWHRAKASECSDLMRGILKERTSSVKLEDGSILGPHQRLSIRWRPKMKADGLRLAIEELAEGGHCIEDYLAPAGSSLAKWLDTLPTRVRDAVEPLTRESTTTTFLTQSEGDYLANLTGEE